VTYIMKVPLLLLIRSCRMSRNLLVYISIVRISGSFYLVEVVYGVELKFSRRLPFDRFSVTVKVSPKTDAAAVGLWNFWKALGEKEGSKGGCWPMEKGMRGYESVTQGSDPKESEGLAVHLGMSGCGCMARGTGTSRAGPRRTVDAVVPLSGRPRRRS